MQVNNNTHNTVLLVAGSTVNHANSASVFYVPYTNTKNTMFRHWLTVWIAIEVHSTLYWMTARRELMLFVSS